MPGEEKPSPQSERPGTIPLPWHIWSYYDGDVGWICRSCGQVAAWQGGGRPCRECGARPEKEYAFALCEQCESRYYFLCRDKPRTAQEIASIKLTIAKRLIQDNQPDRPERQILEELVRSCPTVAEEAAELLRNVPPPIEEPPKHRKKRPGKAQQSAFEAEIRSVRAEIEELRAEIKKGKTQ